MKRGLILLGHGSRRPEANVVLKDLSCIIQEELPEVEVSYGFLQLAQPDFYAASEILMEKGVEDIVVVPFFLNPGIHFVEDIPALLEEHRLKHPQISFRSTLVLGSDRRLAQVILDRFRQFTAIKEPEAIETASMEIIGTLIGPQGDTLDPIIKRVVHTTGDEEYASLLEITPDAVQEGIRALRNGARVITDVEMVRAGIRKEALKRLGGTLDCYINQPEVLQRAKESESTRAVAAVEVNMDKYRGSIVVVGNAPTALFRVIDAVEEGVLKPALIIGTPVGFVGAKESKERLTGVKIPHITVRGTKGGSPVAAAVVNALLIMAEGEGNG